MMYREAIAALSYAIAAAALAAALLAPQEAAAHGDPPQLEFYGNFQSAAPCQRLLSRAARLCFEQASQVRLRCAQAALFGRPCRTEALDQLLDSATAQARQAISLGCSSQQLGVIGYTGLPDAHADVTRTCKEEALAATSLIYGPAMFTGEITTGPRRRDRCLRATARFALKVLRAAVRYRSRALDRIASRELTMDEKLDVLADAEARLERLRRAAEAIINQICSPEEFIGSYGMSQQDFFARLDTRADCMVGASHVQDTLSCPAPECGNAVKEPGEECDDGNTDEGDACSGQCLKTDCDVFGSTFDLIQSAIFERRQCTSETCHDSVSRQGDLDLTAGGAYANLVDRPSQRNPLIKRVQRGAIDESMLYMKLAAATYADSQDPSIGAPMPLGLAPLTEDELDAVRIWIRDGAPPTGVVEETADLLDACLPPPDPIEIEPLDPPAPGDGVQLRMPPNPLKPKSETEVCFATYFDLSDQIPERFLDATRTKFRFKSQIMMQDPLSHHLILHPYTGVYGADHPGWGAWTCTGGPRDGDPCAPTDLAFCGESGMCSTAPRRAVACIGYGPPDYSAINQENFVGIGETRGLTNWAPGVYDEFPVRGVAVWNSHAFNLTQRPADVEAWSNFYFAEPEEQQYPVHRVTDVRNVFIVNLAPFEQTEYCSAYTFQKGVRLFQLSSHTHKRGKLFRIWDPAGDLIYASTTYEDPLQVNFDPPILLDSNDPQDRTYRYCAQYDNGKTNPKEVKRRSTSPPPPPPYPWLPCNPTHCAEGKVGAACSGTTDAARDRSCDSSPGAEDGFCDACRITGGITSDDEMFVFLAAYY